MKSKLGRKSAHRHQTIRNLSISMILFEHINTTKAKSKEVKSLVEKSINIAKSNDLNAKRVLLKTYLHNKNVVNKLLEDLSKRFSNTPSGFIKTYKTKSRLGDNAPMVIMVLAKSKFLNNLSSENKDKKMIDKTKDKK